MTEFLSCRPNLEVEDLAPAAAFLREVLGFAVEVPGGHRLALGERTR
jgi:hypothetical protein